MVIQVKRLFPDAKLPERASPGAVGFDVYAYHVLDKRTREHLGDLPCVMCAKSLMGCGIAAVVVPAGVYPTNGLKLLVETGIEVRHVEP